MPAQQFAQRLRRWRGWGLHQRRRHQARAEQGVAAQVIWTLIVAQCLMHRECKSVLDTYGVWPHRIVRVVRNRLPEFTGSGVRGGFLVTHMPFPWLPVAPAGVFARQEFTPAPVGLLVFSGYPAGRALSSS